MKPHPKPKKKPTTKTKSPALKISSSEPYVSAGKPSAQGIRVLLGYKIVELFSDGLYTSATKAVEELVSNSFDAGAEHVHVILSPDRTTADAFIAVVDDGESMDAEGLRQHWRIGESAKRAPGLAPPKGRKQIGRFGIGKLATFVLGQRFTHICKRDAKFFAATMDYGQIEQEPGLNAGKAIEIPLRALTEEEAMTALAQLEAGDGPGYKAMALFGEEARETWTVALMSGLKSKARDLKKGALSWILRTAMPLRDDFQLFLDGELLAPSKMTEEKLKSWVIGKDIAELPKPAPHGLQVTTDNKAPKGHKYGLTHPQLGRITGYVELYKDNLTGKKSELIDRSNGFFIYVHGRLINITDERFGIDPDRLRHGTFARFRAVLNIDSLDGELRSSREGVRDSTLTSLARDFAIAVFNVARNELQRQDDEKGATAITKRRLHAAPGSLTRRPLSGLLRRALSGDVEPRYLRVPLGLPADKQEELLDRFHRDAESEEGFLHDVRFEVLSPQAGIALYDVERRLLLVNEIHPFVASNRQQFESDETFQLIAVAEILTEAFLYEAQIARSTVREVVDMRDELLRYLARSSMRNAYAVAQALEEAANDEHGLEDKLVAAFESMGFDAVGIGGPGKPDGIASADLASSASGRQAYRVSLEAKSKIFDDAKVSAKTVGISGVARHRKEFDCDHALVVGQDFQLGAVGREISEDRRVHANDAEGYKTVTLIRIKDLARLVRLVPLKGLSLHELRPLFKECLVPDDCVKWIDGIAQRAPTESPFKAILDEIWALQKKVPDEPIEIGQLKLMLLNRNIKMTKEELADNCRALARLVPSHIVVRGDDKIELMQRPDKVLEAARQALQQFPSPEKSKSIFKL